MVPIICVWNHERISWVSIEIYYHDNFVFGHIFWFSPQFLLIFVFCVLTWSVYMLAHALELNTTICRIAYSIWLGARRITRFGLKIMG